MLNIVSQESMLETRRKANIETQVPFILNGKKEFATKKIVNGEMETLKFNKPLGEMISYGGTNVSKELLRKVVLHVELASEDTQ